MENNDDLKKEGEFRKQRFENWQQRQRKIQVNDLTDLLVMFGVWGITIGWWWIFPLQQHSVHHSEATQNSLNILVWLGVIVIAVIRTTQIINKEWPTPGSNRYLSQFGLCAFASGELLWLLRTLTTEEVPTYPYKDYVPLILMAGLFIALGFVIGIVVQFMRSEH